MDWLNYHHLLYFWTVAREGSVRKAARVLNLSAPTISAQIGSLEEALGGLLFQRQGRGLELTDTGRDVLRYADEIFSLGREMVRNVARDPASRLRPVHIGLTDSVPKLISHAIMAPLFKLDFPVRVVCREGRMASLLPELVAHRLDVILADEPASGEWRARTFSHRLGSCGIQLAAVPDLAARLSENFPSSLDDAPVLLPGDEIPLRRSIEQWFRHAAVRPRVLAEFDDTALLKEAASDGLGFIALHTAASPAACRRYGLQVFADIPGVEEHFHAISAERLLLHPAVVALQRNALQSVFAVPDSTNR